jgi:hypothetical protein
MVTNQLFDIDNLCDPPPQQKKVQSNYLPSSFLKRNIPANTGINNLLN